jgi:hypothetical protein
MGRAGRAAAEARHDARANARRARDLLLGMVDEHRGQRAPMTLGMGRL